MGTKATPTASLSVFTSVGIHNVDGSEGVDLFFQNVARHKLCDVVVLRPTNSESHVLAFPLL